MPTTLDDIIATGRAKYGRQRKVGGKVANDNPTTIFRDDGTYDVVPAEDLNQVFFAGTPFRVPDK